MFDFEQWLYSIIASDSTLTALLTTSDSAVSLNVFPAGVDIQPENFPCITYQDAGTILDSVKRMYTGKMQVDIWSKINMQEIMTIYTELATLIDFQHTRISPVSVPDSTILWWIREETTSDRPDTTRRLWRKIVTFKYWASDPRLQVNPL